MQDAAQAVENPATADTANGLSNADLLPTDPAQRTWDWKAYAALWVAMVVCVPTYLLAGGLIEQGMNWWQAVLTVFMGNAIILVPMMLVGHAGAKYGVPFPVLLRSAFGTQGAKIAAIARGLVACGWFGINTWVGGSAIYVILNTLSGGAFRGAELPILGIDTAQTVCFFVFWAMHLYFIRHGTESIRWLETLAAPVLLAMGLSLLGWAWVKAGGFGPMLSAPSQFVAGGAKEGLFWPTFFIGLTAMVGFWATMALNIPDFTRFAKSQKDQMIGQALGLPLPMALYTFIAVAVTSASIVIYGEPVGNPVDLAGRMGGVGVIVALAFLVLATLTTNMAANLVAPAYGFSNLAPGRISFRMGGYITAGIAIAMFPWKLMETAGDYIVTWLVGYSALLGPIAGILIADYVFVKRRTLDVDALFSSTGRYGQWNRAGIIALIAGILPSLPGFLKQVRFIEDTPAIFTTLYGYAWFVGAGTAFVLYILLSRKPMGETP